MFARALGQAIVHALVAALVVEALLRAWRVAEPGARRRLRLLVLALPLVAVPGLDLLAPLRREEWFEERWALLSGRHWAELTMGGVGMYSLFLGALSTLGIGLFLADFIPFLRHRLRSREAAHRPSVGDPRVEEAMAGLPAALGVPAPRLVVLPEESPVLLCRGVRRPELVISRGAIDQLDPQELRAAVAHELGHVRSRDAWWSWLTMAARAAQAFNPVVQVVVRALARDAERRADDLAVAVGGDRLALASAIVKLYRPAAAQGGRGVWGSVVARARAAAIEERCRRLLDGPPPPPEPFPLLRPCLAGAGLVALLFFVV